jgi:hypothetical protein
MKRPTPPGQKNDYEMILNRSIQAGNQHFKAGLSIT